MKKTIARCSNCVIVVCTNLDGMANSVLFGHGIWSGAAKKQAQDVVDAESHRREKRKRTLADSNHNNARIDQAQVCLVESCKNAILH